MNTGSGAGGEAPSAADDDTYPKRVLYERIFVDRAFADDAVQDRPEAERLGIVER